MTAARSRREFTTEDMRRIRSEIEDQLTSVPRKPHLSKSEVVALVRKHGATTMTANKVDYMLHNRLLTPHVIEGDGRDTHLYGRDHVRDVILIDRLKHIEGLNYTQIANLYRDEQASFGEATQPTLPQVNAKRSNDSSSKWRGLFPTQRWRGLFILRSRIVGIMLNWLVDQQAPKGLIVHIRQRQAHEAGLPRGTVHIQSHWFDLQEADRHVSDLRDGDLLGYVTNDGEVLFPRFSHKTLLPFRCPSWLNLSVKFGQPMRHYELTIGFPDHTYRDRIRWPQDGDEKTSLSLLLEAALLELDEAALPDDRSVGNQSDNSTVLHSIAEVIPLMSDAWEYCAILTVNPIHIDHLQLAAVSKDFPTDMRGDVAIEPGQPLTGWAFKWDHSIIVQKTLGPDDPRLAYQATERAYAALALPTHVHGQCNGVLYVGTRYDLSDYGEVFSQPEVRVLRIVADVIGEILERNRIRVDFENRSYTQILIKPAITLYPWNALPEHIHAALSPLNQNGDDVLNENENLHLTVIRNESYDLLRRKKPEIVEWAARHILETTQEYFLRHGFGNPQIFQRHPHSLKEFVCVIPRIQITDQQDRVLRMELRDLLSSLSLPLSYRELFEIRTFVWSMPFRLAEQNRKLRHQQDSKRPLEQVTSDIVREVEEALVTLPRIEQGHYHEAQGAYPLALNEYLTAHYSAPENRYLIRHVAKTYAAVGKLDESATWWKKLVDMDPAARHYSRYAYVLAAQGQFEAAIANYSRALELDPHDAQVLLELGDLLLLHRKVKDAIFQYETALKLERSDAPILWLRIAEANLANGDVNAAHTCAELVLRRQPENQEAKRLMLRILYQHPSA